MNTESQSCAEHFQKVVALCEVLQPKGIAVYEHSFSYLSFGSWTLVVGKREEVLRFTWDGRDGFLTVEEAILPDSRTVKDWKQIKVQGINVKKGTEPFTEASKFTLGKLAV